MMLVGGVSADWLALSLRPALAAVGERDVTALLDARSPGARLAGALLIKVKQALAPTAPHNASAARGPRRRLIPPRTFPASDTDGLMPEDIVQLLGPLEGLEKTLPVTALAETVPAPGGVAPFALIGGAGGVIGGGGSAGGSVPDTSTIAAVLPADTVPVASVPEPSIWLSMLAGFAMAGAALRRR
ncbi:MAG: PEPxxWA-CTERM sorting domain-containing protein, partial [Novosphingobium sp.]